MALAVLGSRIRRWTQHWWRGLRRLGLVPTTEVTAAPLKTLLAAGRPATTRARRSWLRSGLRQHGAARTRNLRHRKTPERTTHGGHAPAHRDSLHP